MARGAVGIEVVPDPAHDIKATVKALKALGNGKELKRDLRVALRRGAQPVIPKLQNAARSLPSEGKGHTGLRDRMAAKVKISVRLAGDPRVSAGITRRVMGTQATLPKWTNRGTWRHRVFGRDVWVEQTSRKGWFDDTAQSGTPAVDRSANQVLEDLGRRLPG